MVPRGIKSLYSAAAVSTACVLLFPGRNFACTTFVINTSDEIVFGRNLDWKTSLGLVIVNKRHTKKTSVVDPPEKPITWVSKYGSVTFNQVGKEFPYGGINEAGLVVEQMTLPQTEYPPEDERPAACEVQWIQFQLDNFGTVREVIASDAAVRIGRGSTKLHFLVADRQGSVAVVEFLRGKMEVHTGGDLPVGVLTNSTYEDCLIHMKNHDGVPQEMPDFSVYRFAVAARMIGDYEKKAAKPAVEHSFDVLRAVGQESTRWSIVYDIKNLMVYFRTDEYRDIKIVDVGSFDYDCGTPARMIDVETKEEGVVNDKFVDYDPAVNFRVVRGAFEAFRRDGFLADVSDEHIREYTGLANAYECAD